MVSVKESVGKVDEAIVDDGEKIAYPTTHSGVGSTLAVMFIVETLRDGGEIEIPSLGITLTQEHLTDQS